MLLNFNRFICEDVNAGTASWIVESFPIIKIVIMSLLALLSIIMIVLVVMQKSDTNGVSAVTGKTDTFYNRNKSATLQGKIKLFTIITAVCIMVLCVTFLILSQIFEGTI